LPRLESSEMLVILDVDGLSITFNISTVTLESCVRV
jgi:hypothetical protein